MGDLLDAPIAKVQTALSRGDLTSVDLVESYLRRIAFYDTDGPKLSAVPILNEHVFEEALESDKRRHSNGPLSSLEGIPFLVKDNIKVKGMKQSSGSPAFEHLVASSDAACVSTLRKAGAIVLGRTNMPPVAYGGMQRGIWGRAESPYNKDFLAAAYVSGSSNGSAVATAANMCSFSLGSETVSSGRSPASNNSIVAYTPSRGWLPVQGVFPLYPTCDVLTPHTRYVEDMYEVLNVLSSCTAQSGDFWRAQPFIQLPPTPHFNHAPRRDSLKGKRIGVPAMYVGSNIASISPFSRVTTRQSIITLWHEAKLSLERCGATVIETDDFPLVTVYESQTAQGRLVTVDDLPDGWAAVERCELVAHAWDDFLKENDQQGLSSISDVDAKSIFPLAPGSLPGPMENANQLKWDEIVDYPTSGNMPPSIYHINGIDEALSALEKARKKTFEDWMDQHNFDIVVFPANADIGAADADTDIKSSRFAWKNGVKYSNGNRPVRHLGVPTVSVPMGLTADIGMPTNLTFLGKAYSDENLLNYAYAFESERSGRKLPVLTPPLASDTLVRDESSSSKEMTSSWDSTEIVVEKSEKFVDGDIVKINVEGYLVGGGGTGIRAYVNGHRVEVDSEDGSKPSWKFSLIYPRSFRESPWKHWESPTLRQVIITVTAGQANGLRVGKFLTL